MATAVYSISAEPLRPDSQNQKPSPVKKTQTAKVVSDAMHQQALKDSDTAVL